MGACQNERPIKLGLLISLQNHPGRGILKERHALCQNHADSLGTRVALVTISHQTFGQNPCDRDMDSNRFLHRLAKASGWQTCLFRGFKQCSPNRPFAVFLLLLFYYFPLLVLKGIYHYWKYLFLNQVEEPPCCHPSLRFFSGVALLSG